MESAARLHNAHRRDNAIVHLHVNGDADLPSEAQLNSSLLELPLLLPCPSTETVIRTSAGTLAL